MRALCDAVSIRMLRLLMTAKLTIVLGPDVLKALRGSNSIRVAVGGGPAPAPRAAAGNGKASEVPQVVIREHAAEGACTQCHQAHAPAIR